MQKVVLIGALSLLGCLDQNAPGSQPANPARQSDTESQQLDTGHIRGVVKNPFGQPVLGARVSAGETSAMTDDDGLYLLVLHPGSYRVSVSASNYATQVLSVGVESGMVHIRNWQLVPHH